MVCGGAPGETWFWCDRWTVALPVPTVGDQLTIRDQLWEIVEVNPDDRGELAFRLIREELGLTFADHRFTQAQRAKAHPTRRVRSILP